MKIIIICCVELVSNLGIMLIQLIIFNIFITGV